MVNNAGRPLRGCTRPDARCNLVTCLAGKCKSAGLISRELPEMRTALLGVPVSSQRWLANQVWSCSGAAAAGLVGALHGGL